MIDVAKIGFSYGDNRIFNDFSVRFEGKITGLIGQNGAGKTTLVNLILGLRKLDSGRITVDGLDISENRNEILKHVGVMFESPEFPEYYTLINYLVFVGRLRGMEPEEATREAESLLRRFDLADRAKSKFKSLSAGMRQKYAIAVAVIGHPKLLLLDEPTANLDVKARTDVLEYLQELAYQHNLHVVILSHILHDLERVCDEVVILHQGRIEGKYSMEDLLRERFIRDYSIKELDAGKRTDLIQELKDLGVENIRENGILLEFSLKDPEQISRIKNYTPVPRRSLLEQVFVDVVGGEIY